HCKVEEAAGNQLTVNAKMLFREMPAARANQQRRNTFVQPVALAFGAAVLDCPAHRIAHINLSFKRSLPRWSVCSLEIRHVTSRAGVERIDHHLAIHRSG